VELCREARFNKGGTTGNNARPLSKGRVFFMFICIVQQGTLSEGQVFPLLLARRWRHEAEYLNNYSAL